MASVHDKGKPRPRDWNPLGDSDPTPGDVEGVRDGRQKMKKTGEEIRAQVSRLKKISEARGLKGKYVDQLQDGSDKLADKLEKSAGRYERVSTQLKDWADDLEDAQSETLTALHSAREAEETIKGLVGTLDAGSDTAKSKEEELDERQRTNLEEAERQLARARSRYSKAVANYREDAARRAKNIRGIIDDAVEDSAWSWVSNQIENHAEGIKKALEILGYIATALAIIALVIALLASGPGWLLLAGLATKLGTIIMAASVGTDILLAATGNGGWGQVAFDAVGLFTFGAGKLAIRGAAKGLKASQVASIKAGRSQSKNLRNDPAVKAKLDQFEARKAAAKSQGAQRAIQAEKDQFLKRLKPRGVATDMPRATPSETMKAGGSRDIASADKFALREAAKRDDPATLDAARRVRQHASLNLAAFGTGTSADIGNKAITGSSFDPNKPSLDVWTDFKGWNPDRSGMVGAP